MPVPAFSARRVECTAALYIRPFVTSWWVASEQSLRGDGEGHRRGGIRRTRRCDETRTLADSGWGPLSEFAGSRTP